MAGGDANFMKTASQLARNPLGVVALFIVLVYAIAGFTLGVAAGSLTTPERLPLVLFLVLFPFAILVGFYRLVTRYPGHLYAPQDYAGVGGKRFLEVISRDEQRVRLDLEAREAVASEEAVPRMREGEERPGDLRGIRSRVLLAEDLALRALETELATPFQRQVRVGGRWVFDAVAQDDRGLLVVEVKYMRRLDLSPWKDLVREFARVAERVSKLILVLVTEDPVDAEQTTVLDAWRTDLRTSSVSVDVRSYSLKELQAQFGV
jgi:hypothetical protein